MSGDHWKKLDGAGGWLLHVLVPFRVHHRRSTSSELGEVAPPSLCCYLLIRFPVGYLVKGPMAVDDDLLQVRLKDLYTTPVIKKLSMTTPFLFFCTYFAYYGIILRLNGMYTYDVYRTVLFTGIVEFTATSVCLGISGRTWINTNCVLFFSSFAAGILCLLINALPPHSDAIPYCLVFARFFMSMTNANLLTAVTELYPTKMRALGAGWANMYMCLGLLCIANAAKLTRVKEGLPVFLMGLSGMVSSLLVLFLPPPLWYGIPDIVEQVETPYVVIGR